MYLNTVRRYRDACMDLGLFQTRTDEIISNMNYISRAAASAAGLPRPSEEVGYLIYCPTMEELEDTCMKELDPENDFEKDDKLHLQTIIARSRVKDEFATIRQSMTSIAGELHLEGASSSDQGHHEANRVLRAEGCINAVRPSPQHLSSDILNQNSSHLGDSTKVSTSSSSQQLGSNIVNHSSSSQHGGSINGVRPSSSPQHLSSNIVNHLNSSHLGDSIPRSVHQVHPNN
ncbi:uncharacterized protein LOC129275003 [Lytechinus pictus]|uniref:uncharacterized protein LOC129275003 n=1 Tax=Lytechinus pictus TaxID=7653 RepID=UPI0030B9F360